MLATSAGIGLLLAFIGLQNTQGLAVVAFNPYNLVALGGCAPEYQQPAYVIPGSDLDGICVNPNGTIPNLPRVRVAPCCLLCTLGAASWTAPPSTLAGPSSILPGPALPQATRFVIHGL